MGEDQTGWEAVPIGWEAVQIGWEDQTGWGRIRPDGRRS